MYRAYNTDLGMAIHVFYLGIVISIPMDSHKPLDNIILRCNSFFFSFGYATFWTAISHKMIGWSLIKQTMLGTTDSNLSNAIYISTLIVSIFLAVDFSRFCYKILQITATRIRSFCCCTNWTSTPGDMNFWFLLKYAMLWANNFNFSVSSLVFYKRVVISVTMNILSFGYKIFRSMGLSFDKSIGFAFRASCSTNVVAYRLFKNPVYGTYN